MEGYAALLADVNTAVYISEEGPIARDAAIAKLQQITARQAVDPAQAYFAIVRRSTQEFIGYVAAHAVTSNICPISYAILPAHRRRGFAKAAILQLCFDLSAHSSIQWFEGSTHPENSASCATLTACGFSRLQATYHSQRTIYRKQRTPSLLQL